MKRHYLLFLFVIILFSSCAKEIIYIKKEVPTPSKAIVLPDVEKGKAPKPYTVNGEIYYPLPEAQGFIQYGKASWYGKKFHGRSTASGEIYDMYQKSAAHKTIPLGTYVKVLNLSNNKETIVKVNDRGPFVKGRIIDLSYGAAKEIELIGPGVVDAKIVALGKEVGRVKTKNLSKPLVELKDMRTGEFTVQIGAFLDGENARRLAGRLKVIFNYVNVTAYSDENKRVLHRVHVSKSKTLKEAGEIEKRLEDMGFTGAFIIRL